MSPVEYQKRLVELGRNFDKLVVKSKQEVGAWQDHLIKYTGNEVFQGVLSENVDLVVKDVGVVQGVLEILVSVRASLPNVANKSLTVYFDPQSPFYVKESSGKVEVSTRKLKQQINFQVEGVSAFNTTVFDTGEIKEGTPVPFSFEYIGEREISGVKGSCGCTNVSFEGKVVQGVIDTQGFKNEWTKTVSVYFGDVQNFYYAKNGILKQNPDCSMTTLQIKGKII